RTKRMMMRLTRAKKNWKYKRKRRNPIRKRRTEAKRQSGVPIRNVRKGATCPNYCGADGARRRNTAVLHVRRRTGQCTKLVATRRAPTQTHAAPKRPNELASSLSHVLWP